MWVGSASGATSPTSGAGQEFSSTSKADSSQRRGEADSHDGGNTDARTGVSVSDAMTARSLSSLAAALSTTSSVSNGARIGDGNDRQEEAQVTSGDCENVV